MNINKYMREHDKYIHERILVSHINHDWEKLKEYHRERIDFIQRERHMHLIVTLSFGIFLLLSIAIALIKPMPSVIVLAALFLVLLVPYVIHYLILENNVQRWYKYMDEIDIKAGNRE